MRLRRRAMMMVFVWARRRAQTRGLAWAASAAAAGRTNTPEPRARTRKRAAERARARLSTQAEISGRKRNARRRGAPSFCRSLRRRAPPRPAPPPWRTPRATPSPRCAPPPGAPRTRAAAQPSENDASARRMLRDAASLSARTLAFVTVRVPTRSTALPRSSCAARVRHGHKRCTAWAQRAPQACAALGRAQACRPR